MLVSIFREVQALANATPGFHFGTLAHTKVTCMRRFLASLLVLAFAFAAAARAQDQKPDEPKRATPMSFSARLLSAKSVYLRSAGGNSIAFDVIGTSFEGWGRYAVVKRPEDADLIVEVTGSTSGGSGISVSSTTTPSGPASASDRSNSTTTTRDLSGAPIKLVIYDAKSNAVMWSAMEQPKSAMRKKSQEDNIVEAAEKLFRKFHDRIEPPPPPEPK